LTNIYYNLGLASGGAGTSGDPWGLAEFIVDGNPSTGNWGTSDDYTVFVRGSGSNGSTVIGRAAAASNSLVVQAWDLSTYGPWRLNITGAIGLNSNGTYKESIIFASAESNYIYGDFYNVIFSVSANMGIKVGNFSGCIIESSGNINCCGSNYATSNYDDCVVSSLTLNSGSGGDGEIINATNCAFSGTPSGSAVTFNQTDTETNYSSLALPAWNAPKAAWDYATILPSIPTPPQPGNPPYTGYVTGLWGNTRTGIGTGYFATAAGGPSQQTSISTPFGTINMLTDSAKVNTSVSSSGEVEIMGEFSGLSLTATRLGYDPKYPIQMKALFTNVQYQGDTGSDFYVKINGTFGGIQIRRKDNKDFALSWKVSLWNYKTGNVIVEIVPVSPLSGVSMTCTCGIQTDYPDKYEEL